MKRMKKIMALMLAAIMMMAMSVTAFAAEGAAGTHTLTVNVKSTTPAQDLKGQTINLYKLFDVTESKSGETTNYAYTVNNTYKAALASVLNISETSKDEEFAKAVADITPGDLQYCFFTNGGAEAVEMALKLARIATGGRWYISTVGAFHGKSMGAISMGGKNTYRVPYTPMVQQVQHVEYGNAEDARKAIRNLIAVGEKVAAMIVEPIQGEAGVIVPPEGYLTELRQICDEYGVALIFDEIQTGMGRTGTMWRCEAEGVTPDIMTFGKAFGGGIMPITGIICKPSMWVQQLIDNPWLLGSPTFGGNPVCCSAAIATIKYMIDNDIPGQCASKGKILKAGLESLKAKYPEIIDDVRGVGLMLAVEFVTSDIGYSIAKGLFSRGVMTAGTLVNSKCIRFEPTAVITEEQIAAVIERMDAALADTKI